MKNKIFSLLLFFGIFTFSSTTFAAPEIIVQQCSGSTCSPLKQSSEGQIFSGTYSPGDIIHLSIAAKNPEQTPIYSSQTWIQYNPDVFEVVEVIGNSSDFPLAAPGEMNAVPEEGLIKIGRAVAGLPITSQNVNITDITLKILKNPVGSELEFYDFRGTDVGKTSLLTLQNMLPENILQTKPKKIIFTDLKNAPTSEGNTNGGTNTGDTIGNTLGNNSGGGSTLNPNPYINGNSEEIYGTQNPYATGNSNAQNTQGTITSAVDIPRPKGLRSRTYADGKTEHLWKMGEDSRIKGYYIYYSTTSGRYMHRRDVGRTNSYQFPSGFFETGKRTYFAVQAYDTAGKTSDFSDETYVVIGHPGSESHPFFEQIFPNVDPQNAVIVRDNNGNIIYKGTRKQNYGTNITTAKKYPNPRRNPQSGMNFSPLFFGGLGLVFILFGGYYSLQKKRRTSRSSKNTSPVQWA